MKHCRKSVGCDWSERSGAAGDEFSGIHLILCLHSNHPEPCCSVLVLLRRERVGGRDAREEERPSPRGEPLLPLARDEAVRVCHGAGRTRHVSSREGEQVPHEDARSCEEARR